MNAKVQKIGDAVGLILSPDILARLGAKPGDILKVTEVEGGVRLSVTDPEFEGQREVMERVMDEDRDVLRALAKN